MKRVLLTFAQFVLFVLVFLVGSFLNPMQMQWFLTHPTLESTRFFAPGGLLAATALYVVILLLEAATKKLRTAALATSVIFAAAVLVGLVAKFGWVTR